MKEINITLRFITPAFIGAVENKKVSEFRLPSLKGLLRFWWRAYQDFPSETELYKAESNIFGDTERKATFSINLAQPLQNLIFNNKPGHPFNINQYGIKYLFFSMYRQTGRTAWLPANTTVDLRFRFFNEENAKEVITALWWLENFGGIGARSRRGAGSFQVTKIDNLEGIEGILQFMCQKWSPETSNLKQAIFNFLKVGIDSSCLARSSEIPPYTAFRKGISNYKVLTGYTSWEEAAHDIGTKLASFRRSDLMKTSAPFQNEAKALHSFATTGSYQSGGPDPLTKTAFGLPLVYHFRNRDRHNINSRTGKPKVLIDESVEALGADKKRRGSPLFIKIGKLSNVSKYYVVALSLWSEFLPDNEEVKIKISEGSYNGKTHDLNQPGKTAIDDFLNSL